MSLGETAWVDKHMTSAWARIAEHVPADWMPQIVTSTPKRLSLREYGCGHYGCVMPTDEDDLVCKLTSDVSEARFVAAYLELGGKNELAKRGYDYGGIVDYQKILAIGGQTHRGRPLFVLWRSEAFHLGFLSAAVSSWGRENQTRLLHEMGFDEYHIRPMREAWGLLDQFKTKAGKARDKIQQLLKKHPDNREQYLDYIWKSFTDPPANMSTRSGLGFIGELLRECQDLAMQLANTDVISPVGSIMEHFLDEGLLLADVHYMNVGLDANRNAVITDPGHVVAVNPRWASWPKVKIV